MPIGPLMIDIAGTELTAKDRALLQNPLIGGLILFSRNYQDPYQIQKLVYTIRNCRQQPILIAVDQEGGRVQRFKKGFTILPSCRAYGEMYDRNSNLGLNIAKIAGWLMAIELLSVGVDMSFAPVLDIDRDNSQVIHSRGFHHSPEIITELARTFISGMSEAGMSATGKHFPGHGFVSEDSHVDTPIDNRSYADISESDLIPFTNLLYILDGIMPAHIIYPQIDSIPAGFSKIWLTEILRQRLKYDGAIFSDDLSMVGAAAIGSYADRASSALAAGCDMILVCNHREAVDEVLATLKNYRNLKSEQRLLKLCGRFRYTYDELIKSSAWLDVKTEIEELK